MLRVPSSGLRGRLRFASPRIMTQPTIASFFGKPASAPKRTLEGSAVASANEGSVSTANDAKPAKKAKEGAADEAASGSTGTALLPSTKTNLEGADLPAAMASHPILQPVLQMCDGWRDVLCREAKKPYFGRLMEFLNKEETSNQTIYPPKPLVFSAFRLCPWDQVKVVILGQDPYHGPNQAHGLAFSVMPPTPTPPSLANMVKEAMEDVKIKKPTHGSLENWSRQGVLLLNAVLTVRRGQANSHQGKGWESFTDAVVRELDARKTGLVFLLWGKPAQEKGKSISRSKHRVLMCAHPSPLSAYKTSAPFIGSRCFSKANEALQSLGKDPIDWNL